MVKKTPVVLVADDEAPLLKLLRITFGLEGFEVVTASNGIEALAAFEGHRPDAAVLDISMPGVDGFGVLEFIRQRSSIPVVMLTARDDAECEARARAAGASDFRRKPFDRQELTSLIKKRLEMAAGQTS